MADSSFPYFLLLLLLIPWLARFMWGQKDREATKQVESEDSLAETEDMLLRGQYRVAAERLKTLPQKLNRGPGGSNEQYARYYLCRGIVEVAQGDENAADESFEAARVRIKTIDDSRLAATLSLRVEVESLGLLKDYDALKTGVSKALALEPQVDDRVALARLVWAAYSFGTTEQSLGHWEPARRLFEEAVRISERSDVPAGESAAQFGWAREKLIGSWADGRSAGARAATHLAEVLLGTGDRAGAELWIERAERLLDGPEHTIVHDARARVLFARSRFVNPDPVVGGADRARLLERVVVEGQKADTTNGRYLASSAEAELAVDSLRSGDVARAIERFEGAFDRVENLTESEPRVLAIRILIAHADAYPDQENSAIVLLRRAIDRAKASGGTTDVRDSAIEAHCKLHGILLASEAHRDARRVLDAMRETLPTLSAEARPLAAIIHAHLLGRQFAEESQWAAAARELQRSEELAQSMDTPMGRYWERQSALQRGIVALSESKPSEAREHLARALACRPSRGPAEDSVERASIQLRLGECLIALEQFDEAGPVLGRAIESGVASGDADGRYLAAAAAWVGACATADDPEERRRFLDTTLRLGRLSGLKAGRELAEKAEAALKEMFS